MRGTLILGAMTLGLVAGLAGDPARSDGARPAREAPWFLPLRTMDRALAAQDVRAAEGAWHEAYLAALAPWEWDGMADVANAYIRLARTASPGPAAMARARNLLAALFRAREQRSVEGVLRAAQGFANVGDRAAAEHAVQVAEGVAAEVGDPRAPARIRAFAATLAGVPAVAPEAGR